MRSVTVEAREPTPVCWARRHIALLSFALGASAAATMPPPCSVVLGGNEPHSILVVDGDDASSHLLAFYLQAQGFVPVVTATIGEAHEALQSFRFVGAFVHVPPATGTAEMALAEALRRDASIPVVLVCDEAFVEDEREGFPRLGRPLDTHALTHVLRRFTHEERD